MKFEDLEWHTHEIAEDVKVFPDMIEIMFDGIIPKQATYTSDCGIDFSVISGTLFYSNGIDTYEIWGLNDLLRSLSKYTNPQGNLSADEVVEYINTACKDYAKEFGNEK